MSQSPETFEHGKSYDGYVEGWRALGRLIKEGKSLSGRERNCVFFNCGTMPFANVSTASGLNFPDDGRGLAVVDWDQDGDLDIWFANRTGPRLRLLLNQTIDTRQNSNKSFVAIRLRGSSCNRDAIGARVQLTLQAHPKAPLMQTLYAGDAFLSQSSKWLLFGLTPGSEIQQVVVRWPGGTQESFSGVQTGKRYLLVQGRGTAETWQAPARDVNLKPAEPESVKPSSTLRTVVPILFPAPLLSYTDLTGEHERVIKPDSKPLLINLWASSCRSCLMELKEWTQHQDVLRDANIDVLALSVDLLNSKTDGTSATAQHTAERLQLPWQVGLATNELLGKLDVLNEILFDSKTAMVVPTSLLLDKEGHITVVYRGAINAETVVSDVALTNASAYGRRKAAAVLPGRWYSPPTKIDFHKLAKVFLDRYDDDYFRYANMAVASTRARIDSERLTPSARAELVHQLADTLSGVAIKHHQQGDVLSAVKHFREALRYQPSSARIHRGFAISLNANGDYPDAVSHLREASRSQPEWPLPLINLAWILATCPDESVRQPGEAVRLAETARDMLGSPSATVLDALAAAYASDGRFEEAVKAAEASIELAEQSGEEHLAKHINSRCRLYSNGIPFIESSISPSRTREEDR